MNENNEIFDPQKFFDLKSFFHKSLFTTQENVWDVIPLIHTYISEQFEKGLTDESSKKVFIDTGTTIGDYVTINGPAIIGKNCKISHGAYFRGNCILGDNVKIGHGVELKNCIVMNNTTIAHLNYVGDSIIGNNINISGGAIVANLRLDHSPVTVRTQSGKIQTNLLKFGSIIGDGSSIGVNAVLNPGTVLGKNCTVFPLTSVKGFYPEGTTIR